MSGAARALQCTSQRAALPATAAFTYNFDGVVRIAACKSPRQSGIPRKRRSSGGVESVPALCTHRPSLLPIGRPSETVGVAPVASRDCAAKTVELGSLEEVKVVTRFL